FEARAGGGRQPISRSDEFLVSAGHIQKQKKQRDQQCNPDEEQNFKQHHWFFAIASGAAGVPPATGAAGDGVLGRDARGGRRDGCPTTAANPSEIAGCSSVQVCEIFFEPTDGQ